MPTSCFEHVSGTAPGRNFLQAMDTLPLLTRCILCSSVIERTAQRSTSDLYDNRGRAVPRQRVGSGQSAASSAVSVQA